MATTRQSKVSFSSLAVDDQFSCQQVNKMEVSRTPSASTNFEMKEPVFGLVNFFALKVLIFDIGIALGDVITDFAQGFALLSAKAGDNYIYGIVTISMNWLPGIVAATHVISMYRKEMSAKRTLTWAFLLLLLYPIVPFIAYIHLLWTRPKNVRYTRGTRSFTMKAPRRKVTPLTLPSPGDPTEALALGRANSLPRSIQDKLHRISRVSSHVHNYLVTVDKEREPEVEFREAEYYAMLAHAISGGIESPLQFVLQVWLIINGKIPKPWLEDSKGLKITDWHGNVLFLPTVSGISLIFSILSMVKAAIEFNIIRVHIEGIDNSEKCWKFGRIVFDHLPFLSTATFFRIACMALLVTYLNTYGFVPVFLFWIGNLVIGYKSFNLEKIPLWLTSFISLFIPACFTRYAIKTNKARDSMIQLQSRTFFRQSISSFLIYIPSLFVTVGMINFYPDWSYDSNVIMSNETFNVGVGVVVAMGIVSLLLSVEPNWRLMLEKFVKYISTNPVEDRQSGGDLTEVKFVENRMARPFTLPLSPAEATGDFGRDSKIFKGCWNNLKPILASSVFLVLIFAPAILPNLILHLVSKSNVYVYNNIQKETTPDAMGISELRILEAIPLNDVTSIEGCLTFFNPNGTIFFDNSSFKSYCERSIIRVERRSWSDCVYTGCYKGSHAVIIDDNNYACKDPTKRTNCFRPSYRLTDLRIKTIDIPMVLVQGNDAQNVLPTFKACAESPSACVIGIAKTVKELPEIPYKCDIQFGKKDCPENEKKIPENLIPHKRLRGRQEKNVTCIWGGRKCLGFDNKPDRQEFCDERYELIASTLCAKESRETRRFKDRKFGMFGDYTKPFECIAEKNVDYCDSNSLWSHYLRPNTENKTVRFCNQFAQRELSENCLLMEREVSANFTPLRHSDFQRLQTNVKHLEPIYYQ